MVKKSLLVLGLSLAMGSSALAADTIVFGAVGSSAMQAAAKTACQQAAGGGVTYTNSSAKIVDGASTDSGSCFIVVSGTPGNYNIWYYIAVDSTVGVRSFFNHDKISSFGATNWDAAGAAPAEVQSAIEASAFQVGMTDITPEDAAVATSRSFGFGYSASTPIQGLDKAGSTYSGAAPMKGITPIAFSLTARPYQLVAIGATPIVFVVNNQSGSAFTHLDYTPGDTGFNANLPRNVLAGFLDGRFTRVTEFFDPIPTDSTPPPTDNVGVFVREPLSGTYNTTEFCVPATVSFASTQESGVDPTSFLNEAGFSGSAAAGVTTGSISAGGRIRTTGTGPSVQWCNTTPSTLAYSFWSVGNLTTGGSNLGSTSNNLKYIEVDGVDPLRDSYVDGGMEALKTNTTLVTFKSLKNGTYPAWSLLRSVYDTSLGTTAIAGITDVYSRITNGYSGADFVPYTKLRVFRSHFKTPFTVGAASNGLNGNPENGGDVGGMIFNVNAEIDFENDFNSQLVNKHQ